MTIRIGEQTLTAQIAYAAAEGSFVCASYAFHTERRSWCSRFIHHGDRHLVMTVTGTAVLRYCTGCGPLVFGDNTPHVVPGGHGGQSRPQATGSGDHHDPA